MDEQVSKESIPPHRLSQLMELAGKLLKMMVTSVWHLTYEEQEIVLGLIRYGIEKAKEEQDVSK